MTKKQTIQVLQPYAVQHTAGAPNLLRVLDPQRNEDVVINLALVTKVEANPEGVADCCAISLADGARVVLPISMDEFLEVFSPNKVPTITRKAG